MQVARIIRRFCEIAFLYYKAIFVVRKGYNLKKLRFSGLFLRF